MGSTKAGIFGFLGAAVVVIIISGIFVWSASGASKPKSATSDTAAVTSTTQTVTPVTAFSDAVTAPPAGLVSFVTTNVTRVSQFAWPAEGRVTSFFGPGHPLGIDIGLESGADSPIRASAAGTVSFAGGNACCEYGYYVELDHTNDMSTLYAHLSAIYVKVGQHVEQGDLLGLGGSTGEADGKHLHFEVHLQGNVVDPFLYLPSAQRSASIARQSAACPSDPIPVDPDSTVSLSFVADDSRVYIVESKSVTPATWGEADAPIEVLSDAGQGVILSFPPAFDASGDTYSFVLSAKLKLGAEEQTVSCELDLTVRETQANAENTGERLRQQEALAAARAAAAKATRTPTATPTRTATPIPSPATTGAGVTSTPISRVPTRVPLGPTATPAPASTAVPTIVPGSRPATPRPAPTARTQ